MHETGDRSTWTGVTTVVLTLAGWSVTPLFIKHFAAHIDPWTSNGWRYGFSALLWAPVLVIALATGRSAPGLMRAAIIPGVINAAAQVCFTWAHYKIDPGLLTFGLRSQMLFVAIGAYVLFPSERAVIRSPWFQLGVALVLGGTIGTIALGGEPMRGAHAFGVVLALAAGAGFAAYGLAVRQYMADYNAILSFAAISQYTTVVMLIMMLSLGDRHGASVVAVLDAKGITWLLLSAVIGIALGHVFYYTAIQNLGVTVSTGVIQLQPFVVGIASVYYFGEHLTVSQWSSGFVAVLGAVLMLGVQHRLNTRMKR